MAFSSSSRKGKVYKSSSGQRHNIDRLEDDDLQESDYGWLGSYKQRALCVRILCPNKKFSSSYMNIDNVKFITRENNSHLGPSFKWHPYEHLTKEDFLEFVSGSVECFDCQEIKSEYWNQINDWMKMMEFKYERINEVDQWTSIPLSSLKNGRDKLKQLTSGQRTYYSSFSVAFKGDMKNGEGKDWLAEMVHHLILKGGDGLELTDFKSVVPAANSSCNSVFEIVSGSLTEEATRFHYDEPFYCSSISATDLSMDLSSLCISSSGDSPLHSSTIVPDFSLALPDYPGAFPLVVEVKPARMESPGRVQNIQQMLTRMFYQDVIFGLVISPMLYEMSVIIRKDDKLIYARSLPQLFVMKNIEGSERKLDMKVLNDLYSFVFGILKWAKLTKCKLVKTPPAKCEPR